MQSDLALHFLAQRVVNAVHPLDCRPVLRPLVRATDHARVDNRRTISPRPERQGVGCGQLLRGGPGREEQRSVGPQRVFIILFGLRFAEVPG